jgi:hypothetical protein
VKVGTGNNRALSDGIDWKLSAGCSNWVGKKIATPCVFNVRFRSKQWNGRIYPFHHDFDADFASRGSSVMRGAFRHLIDRPAMGAGEILIAVALDLHQMTSAGVESADQLPLPL